MNTDEPTLVRQIRRAVRRDSYEGEERRGPQPVNWFAWLPLLLAVLAGVTGYVRTQAKVEELERNLHAMEARIVKELDKAEVTHAAMWRRMTDN